MIHFTATVLKFGSQGEKTGWSYIPVPADLAQALMAGNKKSFRVKGRLDSYSFKETSLLPMGGGDFILAFNATMRKATGKREGAMVKVSMEVDTTEIAMPHDFNAWLDEDAAAKNYFHSIPKSHQHYWIRWIASVKTEEARMSRLTRAINALAQGFGFAEMLRAEKAAKRGL